MKNYTYAINNILCVDWKIRMATNLAFLSLSAHVSVRQPSGVTRLEVKIIFINVIWSFNPFFFHLVKIDSYVDCDIKIALIHSRSVERSGGRFFPLLCLSCYLPVGCLAFKSFLVVEEIYSQLWEEQVYSYCYWVIWNFDFNF